MEVSLSLPRAKVPVTQPLIVLLLVASQYLDVVMTYAILKAGGHELFFLSALALHLGGFAALIVFKSFCALCLVVVITLCEWGWPTQPLVASVMGLVCLLWMLFVTAFDLHSVLLLVAHRG